jgi:hypothetical protein
VIVNQKTSVSKGLRELVFVALDATIDVRGINIPKNLNVYF